MEPRKAFWTAGAAAAFLVLAFLLWAPSLSGPFVLDDTDNIAANPSIRMDRLSARGLFAAAWGHGGTGWRPVPRMTFALSHWLHGLSPGGFRADNVFLHAVAAFFLFLLFSVTLEVVKPGGKASPALAAAAAALWLAHPVQTQAVSYVVQRMAVLAALFSVVSLWAYARGRLAPTRGKTAAWFLLCAASGLLALGSKETAVVLPFLLLLYEAFFFRDISSRFLKRSVAWIAAAGSVAALAALVYTGFHPLDALNSAYELRDFTPGERVLTQLRVVARYASLLAAPWPGRLQFIREWQVSHSLLAPPATLAALAALVLALAAAVLLARKHRLASLAVFWFLGNLVLESSVWALEMSFDHRLYLASAFPVLAVAVGVAGLLENRRERAVVFFLVLAVLSAFSFQRNRFWGNGEALWADSLNHGAEPARCWRGIGYSRLDLGDLEGSAQAYERAVEAERKSIAALPRTPDGAPARPRLLEWRTWKVAGDLNTVGGILVRQEKFKEAEARFREALAAFPDLSMARRNLGLLLARSGKAAEARTEFLAVLQKDPADLDTLLDLGDLASGRMDVEEAAGFYEQAVYVAPESARAHDSLGRVLAATGNHEAAREHLARALALSPDLATAREALATLPPPPVIPAKAGNQEKDSETSRILAVLAQRPKDPLLHNRLGNLCQASGDLEGAARHYQDSVEADPAFAQGWSNLGNLAMIRGDFAVAREHFSRALGLDPENIPALYNQACLSAKEHRPRDAAKWLKKLSAAGFSAWDQARLDPDLAGAWELPECRDLLSPVPGQGAATATTTPGGHGARPAP